MRTDIRGSQWTVEEVASILARELIGLDADDPRPPLRELAERYGVPNDTVNNAMKRLGETNAIAFRRRGPRPATVERRSVGQLWRWAAGGSSSADAPLIIRIPPPTTRRFQGLASGVDAALSDHGIEAFCKATPGSLERLKALGSRQCHLVVMSRFAVDQLVADRLQGHEELGQFETIFLELDDDTYVAGHRRFVRADMPPDQRLRVLIDPKSLDQARLTRLEFAGRDVEFVRQPYPGFARALATRAADGAIWTADEMEGQLPDGILDEDLSPHVRSRIGTSDTRACIIARIDDHATKEVVRGLIRPKRVQQIQKEVIGGKPPTF